MPYRSAIISAIDDLRDCRLTGSSLADIRRRVRASLPEGESFLDSAFLRSLKAAVDGGELDRVGGGDHYKLSSEYRRRRAERLAEEAERLGRAAQDREKKRRTHEGKNKAAVAAGGGGGGGKGGTRAKEAPKRPPEKAKKKLTERGAVVTIVLEGRKTEKMELEKECAPGGGKAEKVPEHKESPRRKSASVKTKITPRRVLKHAVKDPMETI